MYIINYSLSIIYNIEYVSPIMRNNKYITEIIIKYVSPMLRNNKYITEIIIKYV